MRTCKCGHSGPDEDFVLKQYKGGYKVRLNKCVSCERKRKSEYMSRPERRLKLAAGKVKRKGENGRLIVEYFRTHPCVDCGEDDPLVLQFDHVSGEKSNSISDMVRDYSWATILAEIAKCEVRCANCHLRKTINQFNYKPWYFQ